MWYLFGAVRLFLSLIRPNKQLKNVSACIQLAGSGGRCVLEGVGGRCACGKVWAVGVRVEKCGG